MKQVRDFFQASVSFLEGKGITQPKKSVEDLLAAVLNVKRMDVYLLFDRPMDAREVDALRGYIRRRAAGEPVEYILGSVSFSDVDISVNEHVLIPRPETELLIPLIKKWYVSESPRRILDMCTGSGCLALALKKAYPDAEIVGVDISEKAIEIARANGMKNNLFVDFRCSDLFAGITGEHFDLIVSNPPYISKTEFELLTPSVRVFEPTCALLGGEDGLFFYRRFADELKKYCTPHAKIVFEIGYDQAFEVKTLFSEACWEQKRIEQDWSGKDRFFFLEYAGESL